VTVTVLLTWLLAAGAVIVTEGGVVSAGGDWVVALTGDDCGDSFPAASYALTE